MEKDSCQHAHFNIYICSSQDKTAGHKKNYRVVAQSGSAPAWGAGGRRFESCQPDHFSKLLAKAESFFLKKVSFFIKNCYLLGARVKNRVPRSWWEHQGKNNFRRELLKNIFKGRLFVRSEVIYPNGIAPFCRI